MRLFIRGRQIQLGAGSKVAQTKQVNDFFSMNTRQTNYTNTFQIPKTSANVEAFGFLGVSGNESDIPYSLNEAYLYSDEGECFVYKGRAVVSDSNRLFYNVAVFDGNLEIYKAIENATLADLPLTEMQHTKNVTTIRNSWNAGSPYVYVVADYNGKTMITPEVINADYLIPAIPVSLLWDKIHALYGFAYSGQVFNTEDFQNLYITFPKGTLSTIPNVTVFESDSIKAIDNMSVVKASSPVVINRKSLWIERFGVDDINVGVTIQANRHFKLPSAGNYRLKIIGRVCPFQYVQATGATANTFWGRSGTQASIWMCKNANSVTNPDNAQTYQFITGGIGQNLGLQYGNILVDTVINVNSTDWISFIFRSSNGTRILNGLLYDSANPLKITLEKIEDSPIDFSNAFLDFKTKDFFNEMMYRFCLTPFKDKYSNSYKYLTLDELLDLDNVDDWSPKFSEVTNESYLTGAYARRNYMRYKYNDPNNSYNDYYLALDNVNLDESKDTIKSKIYSPEQLPLKIFGRDTNTYKMWDKTVKDDGTVTYKSLDKRFYFMRVEKVVMSGTAKFIQSEETLESFALTMPVPFESFYKLDFQTIIQEKYNAFRQIANNAKVQKMDLYLAEQDVSEVDFTRLKYIKELGSYYLLSTINNYTGASTTQSQLIRLDFSQTAQSIINPITSLLVEEVLANTIWRVVVTWDVNYFGTDLINILVSNTENSTTYSFLNTPNTGTKTFFITNSATDWIINLQGGGNSYSQAFVTT